MNLRYEASPGELTDAEMEHWTQPEPDEDIADLITEVLALFPEDTEAPHAEQLAGIAA